MFLFVLGAIERGKWYRMQKQSFTDVLQIGVLETFANSQENTCVGVSFLIKLQVWGPATLLKRDYNTYVFLWNQQNFTNTYFEEYLRTAADQMICNKILLEKIRAMFCI